MIHASHLISKHQGDKGENAPLEASQGDLLTAITLAVGLLYSLQGLILKPSWGPALFFPILL